MFYGKISALKLYLNVQSLLSNLKSRYTKKCPKVRFSTLTDVIIFDVDTKIT